MVMFCTPFESACSCPANVRIQHGFPIPEFCRFSIFDNYLFTGLGGEHLLALGIASLFNHSSRPTLDYTVNKVSKVGHDYLLRMFKHLRGKFSKPSGISTFLHI